MSESTPQPTQPSEQQDESFSFPVSSDENLPVDQNTPLGKETKTSPAEQFGVVDGNFNVVRSDGTIEQGWFVKKIWQNNEGNFKITIEKPDPANDGNFFVKDVSFANFADWQKNGSEDTSQPPGTALIDSVPQSAEDFAKLEEARLRELNEPIQEKIAKLEEEFDAFKNQFTEDQTLNMWKYASGLMNKRTAQDAGDGNVSYAHERLAGEGLNALKTEDLRAAAETYRNYMERLDTLRRLLL